ncbi:MAG TPA: hypothetical protein VEI97_15715, partial [bacterium]|nr:hypothetical protein [bacterium]
GGVPGMDGSPYPTLDERNPKSGKGGKGSGGREEPTVPGGQSTVPSSDYDWSSSIYRERYGDRKLSGGGQ